MSIVASASASIPVLVCATLLAGGGACATTGTRGLEAGASPRTGLHLELGPTRTAGDPAAAAWTFPALVAAPVPRADRLVDEIRTELGERASLEVRLCVAPAGQIRELVITRGSRLAALDQAILADAAHWVFAATPGPARLRTCERATIVYRP